MPQQGKHCVELKGGGGTQCSMYNITWVYKRISNESLTYIIYTWEEYCFTWFCESK